MMEQYRTPLMFAIMAALLAIVGIFQSWNVALTIVNLCLISSIMTLGVNIQWGYAGLVNFGMMGFTALGGLAAVLIAMPPVPDAWAAGGSGVMAGLAIIVVTAIEDHGPLREQRLLGKAARGHIGGGVGAARVPRRGGAPTRARRP